MKARLFAAVSTLLLTLYATSTPAAAQYATNVILEGPWILYVDTTLINSSHPVLVAVSPGGVYDSTNTNMNMFHTPWVSAGDGYPVGTPNIYCLHWGDEKCAPTVSTATVLTSAISPEKAPLLPMNATQHGPWQWSTKPGITAFILPMPDSYSTVAGWYMRFAPKWDSSGNTYNPYPAGIEKHSIGIELHYKNGPSYSDSGFSYFSLDQCVVNSGTLGICSDAGGAVGHVTKLDNVGTLSITMKSPTTDACDPHVRMAYPKVLGLLDGDNQLYQAIDTAKSTYPSGAAEYDEPGDNPRCLDEYPTSPMAIRTKTEQTKTEQMPDGVLLWTSQLSQFSSRIGEYLQQQHDLEGKNPEDKELLLAEIKTAIDRLNKDFPRFSQMRLILMLLEQSESQAESIPGVSARPPAVQTQNYWSNLLNAPLTVPNLAKLNGYFRATAPLTKSGNDCNAPLILAITP